MPRCPTQLLQQLIRIPSVNPMGGHEPGGIYGEASLSEFLQNLCQRLGLPVLRQAVLPQRDNLLVRLPGSPPVAEGGRLLLWEVHQDTVTSEGMRVGPFSGEQRDGRIYGRGACDVKGGMAAMLVALSQLAELPPDARPNILLALTVNEEFGFTGAKTLGQLWRTSGNSGSKSSSGGESGELRDLSPLFSVPAVPAGAIVAEPTDLNVVVAHKGVVRWRCHTLGRAAHTSNPDLGANGIYAMAQVVQAIERYHREVAPTLPAHPLCGGPTACVSTITGGVGVNTVPERATIEIDRRLSPDEQPEEARQSIIRYIAEHARLDGCRVQHERPFMDNLGLSDVANRGLGEQVAAVARGQRPGCQIIGARYGTDASAIADSGVPTVVFGPGSIEQAHTADEWIDIAELELAAELYYQFGRQWAADQGTTPG